MKKTTNGRPAKFVTAVRALACVALLASVSGFVTTVLAAVEVIDYEDLTEGNQGDPLLHHGITYHDLNGVSGVFPDGSTFEPAPGDEFIVENAGLFYADFPGFGSAVNALTFGISYVGGENLTIGPLSTVMMDLPSPARSASLDIGFYENGPWGGIEFHLDALQGGQVVASDSFEISNLGGRDNPTWNTLAVSTGEAFDQLHLYATFGADYSLPRAMIDDLTLDYLDPSPVVETSWGEVKGLYRQ